MTIAYGSIKLHDCRTLPSLCKKWLSQEWDDPCHQAFGELKSKFSSSPMLKFVEFDKPLTCIRGRVILPLADVDVRWMAIAYESMKLNDCPTLLDLWKKWLSQEWDDACHEPLGSLRPSFLRRPCSSFAEL